MNGLSNFLTAVSVALIVMVLASVRRMHIRVEYSVSWLGAAVMLLAISRSHTAMRWLVRVVGIESPGDAVLAFVGCVFLLVLFRVSVVVSALKDANIALAQRVAILEFHLESVQRSGAVPTAEGPRTEA